MIAKYDKVIVYEDDNGVKDVVVIFDEKLHVPVMFKLEKCGMDEVLDVLNKNNEEKR